MALADANAKSQELKALSERVKALETTINETNEDALLKSGKHEHFRAYTLFLLSRFILPHLRKQSDREVHVIFDDPQRNGPMPKYRLDTEVEVSQENRYRGKL